MSILLLSLMLFVAVVAHGATRPNVLFIVSDDLACRLGSYGDPVAKTPHLDQLAQRGVRFDRAYAQYPVCNPSRTSFLTGLRPDTTRIFGNSTPLRETLPDAITLPQAFRESGYFTASIAKIFHVSQWDPRLPTDRPGSWKLDDERSWDYRVNTHPTPLGETGDYLYLAGAPAPGDKLNFRTKADGVDDDQADGQAVRDAIALFKEKRTKPFFIGVGFRRPHAAWVAPRRYFDLYPIETLRLPEPGSRTGIPTAAFTNREPNYGTPVELLELLQGYLATTTFLDAQVGRLLAALDENELTENTIIVFVGDHGFHLGEHGLWHKGTLFEESVRTPLIIVAPGAAGNGRSSPVIVELVDLFPTLAELCDVPRPAGLAGRSLKPFLENPTLASDRAAFSQVNRAGGRSIRTARWRYTEWAEGQQGAELYDHAHDPMEMDNLASDLTHTGTIDTLRRLLHEAVTTAPRPALSQP